LARTDDILERVVEALKEPVAINPDLDRRVMAEIGAPEVDQRARPHGGWLSRRWTIRLSPVGGLAVAAGLAMVTLAGSLLIGPRLRVAAPVVIAPVESAPNESAKATQFVLVAPDAKTVTLVGDFNDWNLSATHLARQDANGVWWVTVPLAPGRYRYAFVVDSTAWRSDPGAPKAEDEFGRPNSVVTIGGL
jgi:hypothetical protein